MLVLEDKIKKIMKKIILAFSVFAFIACNQSPEGDKASVEGQMEAGQSSETATVLTVDTDNSVITWIGSKPTGNHNGTIAIKSGSLAVENGEIKAGSFIIDMPSLLVLDMDKDNNAKLGGHLMSDDFFDVKKYPTSKFEFVSASVITPGKEVMLEGATHTITGNLTLKDSTKAVTFPAIVNIEGNSVTASAKFNIDRTLWGVHYGNDKSLGDKFIYPIVQIGINLSAKE
jgi:hypothetical protein